MFHLVYHRVSSLIKSDYLSLFLRLCVDETPAVRRSAAQNLYNMVKVVSNEEALVDLIASFKAFTRDDQVRNSCFLVLARQGCKT
jgi:hypothetical protein